MTKTFAPSRRASACALSLLSLAVTFAAPASAADEVNIYSYREPGLMAPLMDAFTRKTGIKTNIVFAKDGLTERIKAEGANSPVDVLLAVDIARLAEAKESGIAQPLKSAAIDADIPAAYRDPEGEWIGLSQRARVIYASRDRVKQDTITYEELADPKWKGRICTRSGQHTWRSGRDAGRIRAPSRRARRTSSRSSGSRTAPRRRTPAPPAVRR